jgi:hypothetical protein
MPVRKAIASRSKYIRNSGPDYRTNRICQDTGNPDNHVNPVILSN